MTTTTTRVMLAALLVGHAGDGAEHERSVPHADCRDRRRDHGQLRRVRDASRTSTASAARMMHMVDEPGTRRLFVSDMRGSLYSVSYDGKTVTPYLDLARRTGVSVSSPQGPSAASRASRSIRSSTERGTPGYGKFYTLGRHAATPRRRPTSCPGGGTAHARHGPARMDARRIRRRRPTTAARRAS